MQAAFISSQIYRKTGYRQNHPLFIHRVGTVLDICENLGWIRPPVGADEPSNPTPHWIDSPAASVETLRQFHAPHYIKAMQEAEASGMTPQTIRETYHLGTMENPVFKGLFERASTSVGGSILAAEMAVEGRTVYHPSGGTHHGLKDKASGFCYFNDPVFAILKFLELGVDRVCYVDLDAHHGDGVEIAFLDDPRVFCISVHEENRWPYTGTVENRGGGQSRNMPVPARFNDSELQFLMDEAILPLVERFNPEALVITCGADGLAGDPLSKLELSNIGLWNAVLTLIGRTPTSVVLGGGGYNPWTVARCWTGLWGKIAGLDFPEKLDEATRALLAGLESDLVDEEDVDPQWLSALTDIANEGEVREAVKEVAKRSLT